MLGKLAYRQEEEEEEERIELRMLLLMIGPIMRLHIDLIPSVLLDREVDSFNLERNDLPWNVNPGPVPAPPGTIACFLSINTRPTQITKQKSERGWWTHFA